MYILKNGQLTEAESVTFVDLNMKESDIEEILRKNVDMLCDDEESMLIVGQQVRNVSNGRSDLTAIDNDGNIVLIEIKRDKDDITGRKEAFEFQAIRYAASCATIKTSDELIQNVFVPYVEKHKTEFSLQPGLTASEIAKRIYDDFANGNHIKKTEFNKGQRIILVASEFDEQTLSAVAWLNSNNVDISCYQLCPYKVNGDTMLDVKKVLPVVEYNDFYVDIAQHGITGATKGKDITRRTLPKIDKLMEWGIVKSGDIISARYRDGKEAILLENGLVQVGKEKLSLQQWLKNIYGWSSVETYVFSVDKKTGKTLSELREAYMKQHADMFK